MRSCRRPGQHTVFPGVSVAGAAQRGVGVLCAVAQHMGKWPVFFLCERAVFLHAARRGAGVIECGARPRQRGGLVTVSRFGEGAVFSEVGVALV